MNLSSENLKSTSTPPLKSNSKHKHITKANTFVVNSLNIDQDIHQLNKFLSNSQTVPLLSSTKFDITPETINYLNQNQINNQRRSRVQWTSNNKSFQNSSNILSNSLLDVEDLAMIDNSQTKDSFIKPTTSVTDMTIRDLNEEFRNSMQNIYQTDYDPKIKLLSVQILTSEDEDDTDDKDNDDDDDVDENNDDDNDNTNRENKGKQNNDYNAKLTKKSNSQQTNQSRLNESAQKTKNKSHRRKRSKSSPKRVKQAISPRNKVEQNRAPANVDSTSPTKIPMSPSRNDEINLKNLITVDTSKARSNLEVVRLCIKELGWKECSITTNSDSDIYWHSSSYHEGSTNSVYNYGRVNKFPGMNDLLRKVHLTRLLNNMRLLFPDEYDFYPKTWFLPEQNQQFKDDVRYIHHLDKKHNRSLTTFIVKPSDGSQGEGIYLLRDPSHIVTTTRAHVVQEYIDRPLLMNGLKFDLRIYVLILNLYPLEVFLYDEGLVRFATVDYQAPTAENLHQTFMHLTNYSLNKRSATYKHVIDDKNEDGSKRKLTLVWRQLAGVYNEEKVERTKGLIVEMVNKTILAILPELRIEYEYELPQNKKENLSCFQIVGFDIILDEHLKPILLEVNANPSLRIDFDKNEAGKVIYYPSPIDEEIKRPLVLETLKLALPKKKLNTIVRHAQLQANEEIMAQRLEKLAQRRVEQRSEKLKSAQKARFDMKLNPFFSRPLESIAKEFVRQQQEQQELEQKRLQNTFPTHPIFLSRGNDDDSTLISAGKVLKEPKKPIQRSYRKAKTKIYTTDDDESGATSTIVHENVIPQNDVKRPFIRSGVSRPKTTATTVTTATTDLTLIQSIDSLKLIFPSEHKSKYAHLFLLDKISYIYIQLVVMVGSKTMNFAQFRNFANLCGIVNETITAPSIDILYYQMLRKWQQFVIRTPITELPFTAFIEAFVLLSQRKFPNAHSLYESVKHLIHVCVHHINAAMQDLPSSSNVKLSHRHSKRNHQLASASLNMRTSTVISRSPAATPVPRPVTIPGSAPPSKLYNHHNVSSVRRSVDQPKHKSVHNSAQSVFPLFFDVL